MTLMFSMIALAGIKIILCGGMDRRETLIVATALGIGLGVSYDPQIFRVLPDSVYVLFENPICAGGVTAIILNLLIPHVKKYGQEDELEELIKPVTENFTQAK